MITEQTSHYCAKNDKNTSSRKAGYLEQPKTTVSAAAEIKQAKSIPINESLNHTPRATRIFVTKIGKDHGGRSTFTMEYPSKFSPQSFYQVAGNPA